MFDIVLVSLLTAPPLLAAADAGRKRRQQRAYTQGWVRYLQDSIDDSQSAYPVAARTR